MLYVITRNSHDVIYIYTFNALGVVGHFAYELVQCIHTLFRIIIRN